MKKYIKKYLPWTMAVLCAAVPLLIMLWANGWGETVPNDAAQLMFAVAIFFAGLGGHGTGKNIAGDL